MSSRPILSASIVLYGISMLLPGIIGKSGMSGEEFVLHGYWILLFGAFGVLKLIFAWYANLIFLFILIFGKNEKPKNVLVASIIAFVLGLTALAVRDLPNLDAADSSVDRLAVGYYVWMTSLLLFVLYSYRKLKEVESSNS